MKRLLLAGSCAVLAVGAPAALAHADPSLVVLEWQARGFAATPVFKSTLTSSEKPIVYPTGQPEITALIATLQPGGTNGLHRHPVPAFVYVLEGTLTLQGHDGATREYGPGQAFVEDVDHWHQAFNRGETPARILVLFVGERGIPVTIRAD